MNPKVKMEENRKFPSSRSHKLSYFKVPSFPSFLSIARKLQAEW